MVTYSPDDPGRAQLRVTAAPHSPVLVLALLQQVLVSAEALLLEAHPAAAAHTDELTLLRPNPRRTSAEHSHSSLDLERPHAAHEDVLLTVGSGKEVSHVGGDDARLSAEVRFIVDDHLHTERSIRTSQSFCCRRDVLSFSPVVPSGFPLSAPPVVENKEMHSSALSPIKTFFHLFLASYHFQWMHRTYIRLFYPPGCWVGIPAHFQDPRVALEKRFGEHEPAEEQRRRGGHSLII